MFTENKIACVGNNTLEKVKKFHSGALGGLVVKDPVSNVVSAVAWVTAVVGSLLWCGFSPWPGTFCMPQVKPKKKKEEKEIHFYLSG